MLTQHPFRSLIALSLIIFVAVALVLMSFATVPKIGTGLLTSAGVVLFTNVANPPSM